MFFVYTLGVQYFMVFSFLEPLQVKIYTPLMFLVIKQRYILSPPCSYLGIISITHMKFGGIEV